MSAGVKPLEPTPMSNRGAEIMVCTDRPGMILAELALSDDPSIPPYNKGSLILLEVLNTIKIVETQTISIPPNETEANQRETMSGYVGNRPRGKYQLILPSKQPLTIGPPELNAVDMTQINADVFLHEGRLWIRVNSYPRRFVNNIIYIWVVDQARTRLAAGAVMPMAWVVPVPNLANGANVIQVVDGGCPCGGGDQCCFVRMAGQQ
ncbi:hypothetical protein CONLIGDRAFT_649999 [Coniochaeta ligniaria NRRL 30616]|uniref:Uncharacterized protein n=1 Tax=Coniochaeta ligniaria NRRL 30616 TaxID=1408157 RepID=A0A1J7J6T0_9PEZI|nr:hypothetical protein CONLIGDRAFT_649999 [Coniochaeta ligniaria NRRL 30616]